MKSAKCFKCAKLYAYKRLLFRLQSEQKRQVIRTENTLLSTKKIRKCPSAMNRPTGKGARRRRDERRLENHIKTYPNVVCVCGVRNYLSNHTCFCGKRIRHSDQEANPSFVYAWTDAERVSGSILSEILELGKYYHPCY